jgi:probable phosphoglycerate mutase
MDTQVILSRHGEAHANVAGLVGGDQTCTGLTDLGRRQVQCLAGRLRAEQEEIAPFDVLYAAPRLRVLQSAEILSDALGLPVNVAPRLAGPRHGEADGRAWSDLQAEFGGAPRSDPDRPYAPVRAHPGQRVLIAGHHETIEASFFYMLGLARDASRRAGFASGHTSLTRWRQHTDGFGQAGWILTAFNDQQHLARAGLLVEQTSAAS